MHTFLVLCLRHRLQVMQSCF